MKETIKSKKQAKTGQYTDKKGQTRTWISYQYETESGKKFYSFDNKLELGEEYNFEINKNDKGYDVWTKTEPVIQTQELSTSNPPNNLTSDLKEIKLQLDTLFKGLEALPTVIEEIIKKELELSKIPF